MRRRVTKADRERLAYLARSAGLDGTAPTMNFLETPRYPTFWDKFEYAVKCTTPEKALVWAAAITALAEGRPVYANVTAVRIAKLYGTARIVCETLDETLDMLEEALND